MFLVFLAFGHNIFSLKIFFFASKFQVTVFLKAIFKKLILLQILEQNSFNDFIVLNIQYKMIISG